jgi:flagellar motility protein MotE (MotC chaperone)
VGVKLRLIPVLTAAAILLLGVKVADIWSAFGVEAASAAADPAAASASAADPAANAAADSAASPPAAAPMQDTAAAPADQTAAQPPSTSVDPTGKDPLLMSPAEIDLLQKLSGRRAELDRRAADMAQHEVLLKATELRLDAKISQLQSLEHDVDGIADKQDAQNDQRLKSLVKIYETMKPADAARIFEQLDLPVLVDMVQRMKEAKASPILAAMDPAKAKQVTVALSERRAEQGEQPVASQPEQAAAPKP